MKKEDILFHPSSVSKIMTDPPGAGITDKQLLTIKDYEAKGSKITAKQLEELERLIKKRDTPPELSETCKKHLIEIYVQARFGREKDITNKYIAKGLHTEEDAITLYSRVKGEFYKKNSERITNSYFTGEPDLFEGESIYNAETTIDTKSCWDLFTFSNAKYVDKTNAAYEAQGFGYMDLTGAKKHTIAYCLVDLPLMMLNDMKRKLRWDMGVIDEENDAAYLEASEKLDLAFMYEDIPLEKRVHEVVVYRDEKKIKDIHERIELCRDWMLETFDWS